MTGPQACPFVLTNGRRSYHRASAGHARKRQGSVTAIPPRQVDSFQNIDSGIERFTHAREALAGLRFDQGLGQPVAPGAVLLLQALELGYGRFPPCRTGFRAASAATASGVGSPSRRRSRYRVPIPIRAEIHCKGLGGAGRRPRRRTTARETSQAPLEGPGRPHQREPGESPTSSTTRALYRCASRAAAAVGGVSRAREPLYGCARRSRSRCARPAPRSTGLSMEWGFGGIF